MQICPKKTLEDEDEDEAAEVLREGKVEGEGKSEVVVRLQPAPISFINVKLARVIVLPWLLIIMS